MAKSKAGAVPKPIQAYYATVKEFEHQSACHEGAVSVAFQTLLSERGKTVKAARVGGSEREVFRRSVCQRSG